EQRVWDLECVVGDHLVLVEEDVDVERTWGVVTWWRRLANTAGLRLDPLGEPEEAPRREGGLDLHGQVEGPAIAPRPDLGRGLRLVHAGPSDPPNPLGGLESTNGRFQVLPPVTEIGAE